MLFFSTAGYTQEKEPGGIWTSISLEKKINDKWKIGSELEFRTLGFSFDRERLTLQVSTDYSVIKNLSLGTGYNYLNVNDSYKFSNDAIREYFQNRHRIYLQLAWKQKIGDFTFLLRERAQTTFKDESDRLNENGEINTNRINPDFIWRNRAKLSYNIKKLPVTPSFVFETYYLLNDPDQVRIYETNQIDYHESQCFFTKLRYGLYLDYEINKKHSIELFGMFTNERGAKEVAISGPNYYRLSDWSNFFVLGISYNINL